MKLILDYKRINGKVERDYLANIDALPESKKDKILRYLKSGEDIGVKCSSIFDQKEKISLGKTIHLFSDGEYKWNSEEVFHFEHYDTKLNADFIAKVLA